MSAADSMATPRRTFLSAIAGIPAVALLPRAAAVVAPLDAAVIAQVAEVRRLTVEYDAAHRRFERLWTAREDAIERELGPKPRMDKEAIADLCVEVLVAFGALTKGVDAAVAAKRRELEGRLSAEIAAWEAASKAIDDRFGVTAADRRLDEADEAVSAAIDELAAMPVASIRGIVAKASIFRAPRPFAYEVHSHEKVAVAIVRDLGGEIEPEEIADV